MAVKTYNLGAVDVVFAGIPFEGFADGTVVTVARNNQIATLVVGGDGEGARAMSNDKGGTVTVVLMQTSKTNLALSAVAIADEESGGQGVHTLLVKDGSGLSIAQSQTAWLQKIADAEYGRELTNRTWVIETDDLDSVIGGN